MWKNANSADIAIIANRDFAAATLSSIVGVVGLLADVGIDSIQGTAQQASPYHFAHWEAADFVRL